MAVAGEMNLPNALARHSAKVVEGVEAVVVGADVDVVDVQQDPAVGPLGDGGQKLPLRDARVGVGHVARHVLEQDPPAKVVLHPAHPAGDVRDRLLGVRQRQQVMQVAAVDAGPAQVIRDPFRLDPAGEPFQAREVVEVEWIGASDGERYPVHDHWIVLADPIEEVQRLPPVDEVVLADDLEPVDGRTGLEHRRVVLRPEPQPEAEEGPPGGAVAPRVMTGREWSIHPWKRTSRCSGMWVPAAREG